MLPWKHSHTITAPPPAWTVDTGHFGADVNFWPYHLRHSAGCVFLFFGFLWACASCRSIFLFMCCCSSPASRLDVCELWDPFCAHNSHKDLLSELPQPFCQLQPVWPFSFDLSSTRHFLQQNYCSLDVTFFLSWFHTFNTILSKDCCTWKSKERNSTPVHLVSTISLSSKSSMFSLSLFLMFPVNINWDSLCTSLLPHDCLTG